mmetsp:Transcript_65917/g.137636  ORF Transcript_65917/g.137636 Transcript_65917/m.137636 type:complete len:208 (-) Transcript_65917:245-868(-)
MPSSNNSKYFVVLRPVSSFCHSNTPFFSGGFPPRTQFVKFLIFSFSSWLTSGSEVAGGVDPAVEVSSSSLWSWLVTASTWNVSDSIAAKETEPRLLRLLGSARALFVRTMPTGSSPSEPLAAGDASRSPPSAASPSSSTGLPPTRCQPSFHFAVHSPALASSEALSSMALPLTVTLIKLLSEPTEERSRKSSFPFATALLSKSSLES